MEFGDGCIGEFVKYKYGINNGEVKCRDRANTCDRALCECDAKFAREHNGAKGVYTDKYHMFWSTSEGYDMWDPENDPAACPRDGSGPYEPECCGGGDGPFVLYNAARKACCADGRVVADAAQC